jgi:hypothetical protein
MLTKTNSPKATSHGGKTRLIISVILVLLTAAFILNTGNKVNKTVSPPVPVNNNISDDFLIGTLNDADGSHFDYLTDSLGFNLWHRYCDNKETGGKWYPAGWVHDGAPGDTLFADSSVYISQVQGVLSNIEGHNMKALMHRPKIEYLCYGQRSDYQCEPAPIDTGMWFYSFNDHETGIPETDSGQAVIHCRAGDGPNHDSPGFVVKRLKTNTEQSHVEASNDAYRLVGQCDWLIKPRIRIDSAYAFNNQNANICRIIVLNQEKDTIKNLILKGRHFSDGITPYNGRYLEEFFYLSNDSTLTIHGAWGDKWWYEARGTCDPDPPGLQNHADIQVWWYGSCDMWIDYVRVDNDIADGLLGTSNSSYGIYDQWLQEASTSGYINVMAINPAEFELNNLPCLKYIEKKMKEYSNGRFKIVALK